MRINFDIQIAKNYRSPVQKTRVFTQAWVDREAYCPSCGSNLHHFQEGKPVADFYCSKCNEEYELKAKKDFIGSRIVDGAHRTMIERLQSNNNPNLFFLHYDLCNLKIQNFLVIPKHFFVPNIIERRKPLSAAARRAGWVGCNIMVKDIPSTGKIYFIRNKEVIPKEIVFKSWNKTLFLRQEKEFTAKGWILDIMKCIEQIGKKEFVLDEIYAFEKMLKQRYPDNRHIRDKIRQQLQILRDKNYLDFVARGKYKVV